MAEKILEVKNLQVSFKTQGGILKAVRNISFDLNKGETLAIVGESGSGKSVTSKAIIGILAGNSIVEGGEIMYDGQDLLKIDEERFHKIRGDKISMIFQDPLSSLNPIMRVGQQITEAMILNGKARQKNAQANFNKYLHVLELTMNGKAPEKDASPEEKQKYKEKKAYNHKNCQIFDKFSTLAAQDEKEFDDALNETTALSSYLDEFVFLLSKAQPVSFKSFHNRFIKSYIKCLHPYVLAQDEDMLVARNRVLSITVDTPKDDVISAVNQFNDILKASIKKEHPNFFRLGYYKLTEDIKKYGEFDFKGNLKRFIDKFKKNKNEDDSYLKLDVEELDKKNLDLLNSQFMNQFIKDGAEAVRISHEESIQKKKELREELISYRKFVNECDFAVSKKEVFSRFAVLNKKVKTAIDPLVINKNTAEYSFGISFRHELRRYYEGLHINPINQRKYERNQAKFDALVQAGKAPTWQVIPPYIIDLELCESNLLAIIDNLVSCYDKQIAKEIVPEEEMVALIDFFKEQCSRFVYKVTPSLARARALDLLKEVGIPDPAIRFRQYPFEFSGGMRQRIVIAIALSANPDILICDEPTTALDVTIQSQILELINKIKKERNLSVIFITHDLGVVANMADKIAVMYAGKIVEMGTSDDIFYEPKHPYTWALLSSMPDLDTKEKLEAIPGTPPNMIYPPKGDAFAERNKYALDIDFELQPPLFEISETHSAATWLLHPNAPKVEMPTIIKERIKRMQEKEGK